MAQSLLHCVAVNRSVLFQAQSLLLSVKTHLRARKDGLFIACPISLWTQKPAADALHTYVLSLNLSLFSFFLRSSAAAATHVVTGLFVFVWFGLVWLVAVFFLMSCIVCSD